MARPARFIGAEAEEAAARFLTLERGFTVLERNFTCHGGELDLVCDDAGTLVFVEVRARQDDEHGDPLETIGPQKRARVVRAARLWLLERGIVEGTRACRFDVVGIADGVVTHVPNAFEE